MSLPRTCEGGCTAECAKIADGWWAEVEKRIAKRRAASMEARGVFQLSPSGRPIESLSAVMDAFIGYRWFVASMEADPDRAAQLEAKLADLARTDYALYLRTDYWKTIRMELIRRADESCRRCAVRTDRLHVHHPRYDDLLGQEWRKMDELEVLCARCHEIHHGVRQ